MDTLPAPAAPVRLLVLLLAVVLVPPPTPAAAAPPAAIRARQQLRQVRRELEERRAQLRVVRQQERRVLHELEEMDRRREAAEADLRRLEVEQRQIRARAQATATRLAVVRARLAGQRARVRGRLRDIYKWGRRGYLDLLLDATDLSELVTRAHFLGTIMRADARLLARYGADVEEYARLYLELETQQEEVATLIARTQARRARIAEEAAAKERLLARIQSERALYEQVIEDLEETDRNLVELIRRMQPAGPPVLGGRFRRFAWPARGSFTSGFGMRVHPIFRIRRMHSGVDIAAPHGAPVAAAWDGTVLYAGWFGGYGKIVIIDHGEGVSTLYAHLSAVLTAPGARVRQGEVIGRVGSTGFSTGSHVHFEIRVNGTPVNPVGP